MSGIFSIAREVLGFWQPQQFPESRLLSASLVSACAISFAMAWWIENLEKRRVEAEKRELEEQLRDKYPRLEGEIVLGYLDSGKQFENEQWIDSSTGAVATFYVRVVNHSNQDAWLLHPPTLKMTLDGIDYSGTRVIPQPHILHAHDTTLKGDKRIIDVFQFSIGGMQGVLQKPRLHAGWLMFNLGGPLNQLDSEMDVVGSVTITLDDTLGKVHSLRNNDLRFRLNMIGLMRPETP